MGRSMRRGQALGLSSEPLGRVRPVLGPDLRGRLLLRVRAGLGGASDVSVVLAWGDVFLVFLRRRGVGDF